MAFDFKVNALSTTTVVRPAVFCTGNGLVIWSCISSISRAVGTHQYLLCFAKDSTHYVQAQ